MNERALKNLEFDKVKEMLAGEAISTMAKALALELVPTDHINEIQTLLSETSEAVSIIIQKGALPLGGINQITTAVVLAEKGGTLSIKQLLEVKQNLFTARKAAEFLKTDNTTPGLIVDLGRSIRVLKQEEQEIDLCIVSENQIADGASAELRSIRKSIARQNEALRAKMSSMIQSRAHQEMFQDAIVTMRQGRYVIPVKQEHRAKFPGIIHDQSATGATLFIEPQAIVNLNNELRELQLKEQEEIQKILAMLSAMIGQEAEAILANQNILIKLDYIFAKGKLSLLMKGQEPELNQEGFLRIKEGRHPLIDRQKVVPMNIHLGKDFQTLVITGPNTGGKTVTLKTVGLMVLMTQAGLHIPTEIGTKMPIFKQVFADIGDEQSIEQSLSTFSSHMTNIVTIVAAAESGSLVLLDELGAGTDPTEGAALAIAILDSLLSSGAMTMATTHYTELKKYALSTASVENGCMEFNVETLSPTYKLSIGMAGKSNAFEISQKLGLREDIIHRARALIERGDIEFEDLITAINADRKQAEAERDEAILLNIEMKKMKDDLQRQKEKFETQKEKIISQAKSEARDMVKEMKDYSNTIFKELRELESIQDDPKARNRKFEEIRTKVRERSRQYEETMPSIENKNPVKSKELRLGMKVKVITLEQEGIVLTMPDEKGDLSLQVGLMKVNVNLSDLEQLDQSEGKKQTISKYGSLYKAKAETVHPSFDVRGCNLDEACSMIDKYIDDAFIAGLKQVTIVHGKGEGILREGLKPFFKKHKHVQEFRPGMYNEGAEGVTILTLK